MHASKQLLARAYAGKINGLDLAGLAAALEKWYLHYPDANFLHPCVIADQPALVCQAKLSQTDPAAFAELRSIAERHGIFIKEDNRVYDTAPSHNRRRNVGLVLSFCVSLLATTRSVTADELFGAQPLQAVSSELPSQTPSNLASTTRNDGVILLRRAKPPSAAEVLMAYNQKQASTRSDSASVADIEHFLLSIYHPESGDPETLAADLAAIARYYARFPATIGLISELRGQNLQLKYQAGTWQTQAWGTQHQVDSATVYFDTRLGAQLMTDPGCETSPACSISPADALLHELLHAKLMLLDAEHFIAEGGMTPSLYPFEHEREVIGAENQLYSAMNQTDGLARPIRSRHSGALIQVACPLCNPIKQLASIDLSQ